MAKTRQYNWRFYGKSIQNPAIFFWHKFFNRNAIVNHFIFQYILTNNVSNMSKTEKKSGPKHERYVNREQDHKMNFEKMRKQAASKFGKSKEDA